MKNAKLKMLEHREKAVRFEKLARAFAFGPRNCMIRLTIDDIDYFKLGDDDHQQQEGEQFGDKE